MSQYDQQATDFLAKHEITFSFKLANTKVPSWSPDRKVNHFIVTFKQGKKRMSFDFFDSAYNYRNGKTEITAYDALTICSSEINCPDTFKDFCIRQFITLFEAAQLIFVFISGARQFVRRYRNYTPPIQGKIFHFLSKVPSQKVSAHNLDTWKYC